MGNLSVGQVVLVRFPFSDLSSKKVRPALMIGLAEFGDVILCQITSQSYGSRLAIPLKSSSDFNTGSIAIDSFIRPDKIVTLDQKLILQVLGDLNAHKLDEVKAVLQAVLRLD